MRAAKRHIAAVAALAALATLAGCDADAHRIQAHDELAPLDGPRVKTGSRQPFWTVRRGNPTRLSRRAPAPLEGGEPVLPEGVVRATYASGSLELAAWLAVPPGPARAAPRPAGVYLHGYFGLRADAWPDARRFLDAGFVVMMPMLRGENGNPGDFELFFGELDDAAAAVTWLAARPEVDPKRVYAFGHSVGGGLAGLLTLVPDLPLAGTGSVGGTYSAAVFDEWSAIVPFDRRDELELRMRLLAHNFEDMQRPLLAYVGSSDRTLRWALPLSQAARRRHAPFSLEIVKGDHFTSVPRAIDRFIVAVRKRR
jgi:acetyl esterase/lipase